VIPPVAPDNQYVLSGFGDYYKVPMEIGLSVFDPHSSEPMLMFARFFGGEGAIDFEIVVSWQPDISSLEDGYPIEYFGPYTVYFREDETIRDYTFPFTTLPLRGVGRYELRLFAISGVDPDDNHPLAVEYFEVFQS
jgi:hypothetical protein